MGENPANPGFAWATTWSFAGPKGRWQEQMDLVRSLSDVLQARGRTIQVDESVIVDVETQLSLRPLLQNMTPGDEGVQTVTTIEVKHAARIPAPIFEFQHSGGQNIEASVSAGFQQWYDCDFTTLRDAIGDAASACQDLLIGTSPECTTPDRRVTLGPVLHHRQRELPESCGPDGHPFCPCCLFTNSIEAFRPQMLAPGFHALRLLVVRDQKGRLSADCRVNGEDHAAGQAALIQYAQQWPDAGFEFRKQYVVIQSIPGATEASAT